MASRLHQRDRDRDPRSALFEGYDRRPPSTTSRSPAFGAGSGAAAASSLGGYNRGYQGYGYAGHSAGVGSSAGADVGAGTAGAGGYRSATPNSRGQYSDAVLSSLESQNDEEIEGISAKVKMLKNLTVAIGDEIRDSSALAEKMNDTFDSTRVRLRGTMNRMLVMAQRTGVGWRVWVLVLAAVVGVFWYAWLF